MVRDYRRGAAKVTPRRTRPRSCVWWFLLGTLTGSFGIGLYWMTQTRGPVTPPVAVAPKPERPAPQEPNFQFENILRDTVVDIKTNDKPLPPPAPRPEPPPLPPDEPDEPVKPGTPPADAPKKTTAAPAGSGTYVLQVGSFKTAKDADRMKAQLAMLGVSTRVQSVTMKNGDIWYRVMTGPLEGKKAMEQTRATLQKHGKEAIPVKVK